MCTPPNIPWGAKPKLADSDAPQMYTTHVWHHKVKQGIFLDTQGTPEHPPQLVLFKWEAFSPSLP